MNNNKLRSIAFLLMMVLLIGMCPQKGFADDSDITAIDVMDIVAEHISAMKNASSAFNAEKYDFSNMYLGDEIPVYEVLPYGIVRIDKIHTFPVFSGKRWISNIIVFQAEDGNGGFGANLSDANIVMYNKIINTSDKAQNRFAIVLDYDSSYAILNGDIHFIEEYSPVERRAKLSSINADMLDTQIIAGRYHIDTYNVQNQKSVASYPTSYCHSVPNYTQPSQYTCWASTVRSILNYRGYSYGYTAIYTEANLTTSIYVSSSMRSTGQCRGYTEDLGGSPSSIFYESNASYSNIQSMTYNAGKVIFAGFVASGAGSGHAMVIDGFYTSTSNIVYVMNPYTGGHTTITYTSGKLTYINASYTYMYFSSGFKA